MLKKSLLIVFSFFYFFLASGININLHYCGGKLKDISLFSAANEDGCCGSKKKSKGCCDEKNSYIKVKDNHFPGNSVKTFGIPAKNISDHAFLQIFYVRNLSILNYSLKYYTPPVLYDDLIYLKYRVLVI